MGLFRKSRAPRAALLVVLFCTACASVPDLGGLPGGWDDGRLEYRYSDLSEGEGTFARHRFLAGIAYRF